MSIARLKHECSCCQTVFVQVEQFGILLQVKIKYQKCKNAKLQYYQVYFVVVTVSMVFYVKMQSKVVTVQRCYKQKKTKFFFPPHNEVDGPGLQVRDLSNSQMGAFPKSLYLHCAMIEINQKARKGSLGLQVVTIHSGF